MDNITYTVYFGLVPAEFLNGEEYYYFLGNYYYFVMEVQEDCCTIFDTCGRLMPIDYTQIKELKQAVKTAQTLFKENGLL